MVLKSRNVKLDFMYSMWPTLPVIGSRSWWHHPWGIGGGHWIPGSNGMAVMGEMFCFSTLGVGSQVLKSSGKPFQYKFLSGCYLVANNNLGHCPVNKVLYIDKWILDDESPGLFCKWQTIHWYSDGVYLLDLAHKKCDWRRTGLYAQCWCERIWLHG